MTLSIDSRITLNNGVEMPRLGLGVYKSAAGEEAENAVRWALETGYRAIDTAALYANEAEVGKIAASGIVPREDIFITSKAWIDNLTYEGTKRAFADSMAKLNLDYVDLYLVHWPANDWKGAWRALEEIYAEGRVRAIGVSNFLQPQLEELYDIAKVLPVVNQIEFHPFLQQPELQAFCRERNLPLTAWAPLMKGRVLEVPELVEIGQRHGKSPVHVTLRWMLQIGVLTIPKSVKKERIESNADLYDFALTDEEIAVINGLDRGERIGAHPDEIAAQFK